MEGRFHAVVIGLQGRIRGEGVKQMVLQMLVVSLVALVEYADGLYGVFCRQYG